MSKVKVSAFSVSLDGYGAGPDQSRENPLGKRGGELHQWLFPTKMFQNMYGKVDGTEGRVLARQEISEYKIWPGITTVRPSFGIAMAHQQNCEVGYPGESSI